MHLRRPTSVRARLGNWPQLFVAIAALSTSACVSDEPVASDPTTGTNRTTATQPPAVSGPIEPLDTEPLGDEVRDWRGLASDGRHLYASHDLDDGHRRLVRFDPDSGRVLVEVTIETPHLWTAHPEALVVVEADRRTVTLRDPLTLAVRHQIDLGEDTRADFTGDTPSGDRLWLPLRRYNQDFLAGLVTRIGVARLDLRTGEIAERRDTEPCGTRSAVELEGVLVMGMECTYQVAVVDLASGRSELLEALPIGAQLMVADDAAVMRWPRLGVIGRWRPGDTELTTLDLSTDLPPVLTVVRLVGGPRGIWAVTDPVEPTDPRVLHLVDPDEFRILARTEVQSTVAFIGARGFTITDGVLARWDPASVRGGAPPTVTRPATGAPTPVQPSSPDEQAAIDAFRSVWTPSVPDELAGVSMIDAERMLPVRTRLISLLNGRAASVEVVATAIAVDGDVASLNYVFLLDGRVAFVPLSATLRRVEDRWMVTPESVCRLASQAPIPQC